jgi:hypothetical protein
MGWGYHGVQVLGGRWADAGPVTLRKLLTVRHLPLYRSRRM